MGVIIDILGTIVDADAQTRASLSWDNPFWGGELKMLHTLDLSVPATPANNAAFALDRQPAMPGIRHRMRGTLQVGGVVLKGGYYLLDYKDGRYNLLFEHGASSGILTRPLGEWWQPSETIVVKEGDRVEEGGILQDFGWLYYTNNVFNGTITTPLTCFPAINLGWMLREACQAAGLTVTYPQGQYTNADNFALVLASMDSTSEARVDLSLWDAVAGGSVTVQGGGTLQSAGLQLVQRRYKRGAFNSNKEVYTFEATRGVTITFPVTTDCWVVSGMGYEWRQELNPWGERHHGCTFELAAGEWFTVVSDLDLVHGPFRDYWHGTHGYETEVTCYFTVKTSDGIAGNGSVINLADNLPDLSLCELLDGYAAMIGGWWTMDVETGAVEVMERSVAGWSQDTLHRYKVLRADAVRRYPDGWARHNLVECRSADYVEEASRYRLDYQVGNDGIEEERQLAELPWNEGNMRTINGERVAVLRDVAIEANGTSWQGELSCIYMPTPGGGHINTIRLDGGVGSDFKAITLDSVTIELTALMAFRDFETMTRQRTAWLWYGVAYVVKSATWSDGEVQLVLCSVGQ